MISAFKAPRPAVERQGRALLLVGQIHDAAWIALILERIKFAFAGHRDRKGS